MRSPRFIIWSGEHMCFWRENQSGYTQAMSEAGLYSKEEAEQIILCAGPDKKLEMWSEDAFRSPAEEPPKYFSGERSWPIRPDLNPQGWKLIMAWSLGLWLFGFSVAHKMFGGWPEGFLCFTLHVGPFTFQLVRWRNKP